MRDPMSNVDNANNDDAPHAGLSRREAMATLGAAGVGAMFASGAAGQSMKPHGDREAMGWSDAKGKYTLPPLPYDDDALEPHIDAQTMKLHHDVHHQGYVNGLNNALEKLSAIRAGRGDAGMVKHWSQALAFHGSGHVNHTLFWTGMAPRDQGGGGEPSGELAGAIGRDFGSFAKFREHFTAAAGSVEGSGWGWLAYEPMAGRLLVLQAEKHQNLTIWGVVPLLGVDVWEHAYYLKYQNRRGDYVDAFMDVVNWDEIARRYEKATA